MKTMKKLAFLLLALVMALALAVPAFAAGETYSITINNATAGHTYEAYQIFKGDLSTNADGKKVLSNILWGNGVDQTKIVDGKTLTQAFDGKTAAEVAETIKTEADAKAFAQKIAPYLTKATESTTQTEGKYVISGLAAGYYLVKDKDNTLTGEYDFYTAYIMKVVDDVDAKPKGDKPSVGKKIVEGEQKVAANTASIGDSVKYEIASTVPNMTEYNGYIFVLEDTLSKGLTYNEDMVITVGNKALVKDTDYTLTVVKDDTSKTTSLKIVFKNFIQYKDQTGADIKVTYSATLNQDADLTQTGNPNEVKLIYSNNPNYDYSGVEVPGVGVPTGETPESETKTYVTGIKITKVDGETKETLTGAKFEIKGDGEKVVLINKTIYKVSDNGTYYMLKNGTYTETAPTDATKDSYDSTTTKYEKVLEVVKNTVSTKVNATGYVNDNGVLTFEGLGAGEYTITEIIAPDGYNLLDKPITITITANATLDKCEWTVKNGNTELTAGADHLFALTVENKAGSTLPSTGGIGTTIFYVVGSVLVIGAAVMLITRKRMGKSDK